MYKNVWWHNPLEYGSGLNTPKTWPAVWEQYRRPADLRYYDLPVENYTDKLYYERPRMGQPVYRGKFRDKPHTVTSYYPQGIDQKPAGFYGRLYYEDGPPQFKYQGPRKDDLYWLENPELQPSFPRPRATHSQFESQRGLNAPRTSLNHPSLLHLRMSSAGKSNHYHPTGVPPHYGNVHFAPLSSHRAQTTVRGVGTGQRNL